MPLLVSAADARVSHSLHAAFRCSGDFGSSPNNGRFQRRIAVEPRMDRATGQRLKC